MSDSTTARLVLSIARGHLDRRCNSGTLPAHVEFELAGILSDPGLEALHSEALALLNESRGLP